MTENNNIKTIYFILCIIAAAMLFNGMKDVAYRKSRAEIAWSSVYNESIDVVVFGNSHCFLSMRTDILTELGIPSTIIGNNRETFTNTYYNVLEVISRSDPNVIVIELNSLFANMDHSNMGLRVSSLQNLYGMRFGMNKINAIFKCFQKEDYAYALFPQVFHHEIWKKPESVFANRKYNNSEDVVSNVTRGFIVKPSYKMEVYGNTIQTGRMDYLESSEHLFSISDENILMLEELINLCEERDINLEFYKAPVLGYGFASMSHDIYELKKRYDINVIDYNLLYEELKFGTDDYFDDTHLSVNGANKLTFHFIETILVGKYGYDINLDDLYNSKLIKSQLISSNGTNYILDFEFFNSDVEKRVYITRKGNVIDDFSYSNNRTTTFSIVDAGTYKIKWYARFVNEDPNIDRKYTTIKGVIDREIVVE